MDQPKLENPGSKDNQRSIGVVSTQNDYFGIDLPLLTRNRESIKAYKEKEKYDLAICYILGITSLHGGIYPAIYPEDYVYDEISKKHFIRGWKDNDPVFEFELAIRKRMINEGKGPANCYGIFTGIRGSTDPKTDNCLTEWPYTNNPSCKEPFIFSK